MTFFDVFILFCVLVFILWSYLNNDRERIEEERLKEERQREQEEEGKKKLEESNKEQEREKSQITVKERLFGSISTLCRSGRNHITILLSGKTGAGKSSLVNGLIGQKIAAETNGLDPGTTEVNRYDYRIEGMEVTLFDTPGLTGTSGNKEVYLKTIKEKVTCPCDVFIFCTEMTSRRLRSDDIKAIQILTDIFSPQLWEHVLVALTFANEVHSYKNADVTEIEYFNQRMLDFKKAITDFILKAGAPEQVVTKIPFVATGDLCEPSLPGITDWKTNFWFETFSSLKTSAQMPFFLFNSDWIETPSTSSSPTEKVKKQQGASSIHVDNDSAEALVKTM